MDDRRGLDVPDGSEQLVGLADVALERNGDVAELRGQVPTDEAGSAGDEGPGLSAVVSVLVPHAALEQGKALREDPVLDGELRDHRRVVQEHDQDEEGR